MEFYNTLGQRRSIRGYRSDPVPPEKLERIREAVRLAPSACNRQPYRFLLAESDEARGAVCSCYRADWLAEAPLIVVALGNREEAWKRLDGTSAHPIDVAIAMEHLVLAAASEGLGTCWVCAFDQQAMHRALGLEARWDVVALTPLGVPGANPRVIQRKSVDELFEQR